MKEFTTITIVFFFSIVNPINRLTQSFSNDRDIQQQ